MPEQDFAKKLVKKGFDADFALGQWGQLECVPASLRKLQETAQGPDGLQILRLSLMIQVLGIAGLPWAKGKFKGDLWSTFYKGMKLLENLSVGKSSRDVYESAIEDRKKQFIKSITGPSDAPISLLHFVGSKYADWEISGNASAEKRRKGRNTAGSKDEFIEKLTRALIRLSAFIRSSGSKDDLELVLGAALTLDSDTLHYLVDELNINGINDGWAIVLMYAPLILQNVTKGANKNVKNLSVGLKCLARLYEISREQVKRYLGQDDHFDGDGEAESSSAGHQFSAHGVYEVRCFQVSTWAEYADKLTHITENFKTQGTLVFSHIYLEGNFGEAELKVEMLTK